MEVSYACYPLDPRMGKEKNPVDRPTSVAKCAKCSYVFTTDGNFDRHIRGGACIQPERAGLERKSSGRYGMPGRTT